MVLKVITFFKSFNFLFLHNFNLDERSSPSEHIIKKFYHSKKVIYSSHSIFINIFKILLLINLLCFSK
jgi:hypothetical protein